MREGKKGNDGEREGERREKKKEERKKYLSNLCNTVETGTLLPPFGSHQGREGVSGRDGVRVGKESGSWGESGSGKSQDRGGSQGREGVRVGRESGSGGSQGWEGVRVGRVSGSRGSQNLTPTRFDRVRGRQVPRFTRVSQYSFLSHEGPDISHPRGSSTSVPSRQVRPSSVVTR